MLGSETLYKLMRLLEATPEMSQRDVARELGISLGSTNSCLRTLVGKGWLKTSRFQNERHKVAYRYVLTPRGVKAKASQTVEVLQAKKREYAALRIEIRQMHREARKSIGH
jgi:EPS-associated MarR family transcriptional regulator